MFKLMLVQLDYYSFSFSETKSNLFCDLIISTRQLKAIPVHASLLLLFLCIVNRIAFFSVCPLNLINYNLYPGNYLFAM